MEVVGRSILSGEREQIVLSSNQMDNMSEEEPDTEPAVGMDESSDEEHNTLKKSEPTVSQVIDALFDIHTILTQQKKSSSQNCC